MKVLYHVCVTVSLKKKIVRSRDKFAAIFILETDLKVNAKLLPKFQ